MHSYTHACLTGIERGGTLHSSNAQFQCTLKKGEAGVVGLRVTRVVTGPWAQTQTRSGDLPPEAWDGTERAGVIAALRHA